MSQDQALEPRASITLAIIAQKTSALKKSLKPLKVET